MIRRPSAARSVRARRVPAVPWVLMLVCALAGCRQGAKKAKPDAQLMRLASDAREAFALGVDATALARYRQAVKRAWALDDPVEIARCSYNLAACLTSVGRYDEARGWLAESRVELARTGRSSAEAWLLEAKVARQQGRWAEAEAIRQAVAARLQRGNQPGDDWHLGGIPVAPPDARCGEEFDVPTSKWSAVCEKLPQPAAVVERADCRDDNREARRALWVFEANLACDRGDVPGAQAALDQVRRAHRHGDQAEMAEIERVSGRIALLTFQPAEAGRAFDREAERFRRAGHYREVAFAFYDAGEAYESAGMAPLAIDRYLRTARMLYARDAWVDALLVIELCLPMAESLGDADLGGRLGIIFREVSTAAETAAKKSSRRDSSRSRAGERPTAVDGSAPNAGQPSFRPLPEMESLPAPTEPPDGAPESRPGSLPAPTPWQLPGAELPEEPETGLLPDGAGNGRGLGPGGVAAPDRWRQRSRLKFAPANRSREAMAAGEPLGPAEWDSLTSSSSDEREEPRIVPDGGSLLTPAPPEYPAAPPAPPPGRGRAVDEGPLLRHPSAPSAQLPSRDAISAIRDRLGEVAGQPAATASPLRARLGRARQAEPLRR